MQKTISQEIKIKGIGVHSGKEVLAIIKPAKVNSGLQFITPLGAIDVCVCNLDKSPMCTTLKNSSGAQVRTVEHFLAAVKSLRIDNLQVELTEDEMPILDGSAIEFVEALKNNRIEQAKGIRTFKILKEIVVEENGKNVRFQPLEQGFEIDVTCDFSNKNLGITNYKYIESEENFINEIAFCRTFGFEDEAKKILELGLAKGASLDNTVIFDNSGNPINDGGLRIEREFIRHKVLDVIGDTSVCGGNIIGKFIGYCPGHSITAELMRKTFENTDNYIELS